MCLGIPMKISSINGHIAHCERDGIQRNVNIYLLQQVLPKIGDYVLVHVGYAIQIIEQEEAIERLSLHNEMQALKDS